MTANTRRAPQLAVGLLLLAGFASAEDWPQWLGTKRDGVWRESGIVERFPEGGPKLRWSVSIRGGYAGPSVAGGRVFVPDFVPGQGEAAPGPAHKNRNYRRASRSGTERVLCLEEATGRILWKHERPVTYTHAKLYANGPRTTPLVEGESVYTLGGEGRLACLDVATGDERWARDFKKDGLSGVFVFRRYRGMAAIYRAQSFLPQHLGADPSGGRPDLRSVLVDCPRAIPWPNDTH